MGSQDDKIWQALFKLKIICTQQFKRKQFFAPTESVEKLCGKGENAGYQHIFSFSPHNVFIGKPDP